MTDHLAPPPSRPTKPEKDRRRRILPPLFRNPDTRSVEIGVAGTILVHLLVLLFAPRILQSGAAHVARRPTIPKEFKIDMAPPPPPLLPPQPKKFVEANPNANHNIPDRTNNIAAQNQRVAQPKPNPTGKSDMPSLEGRKDIQSTQIVTGTLSKPVRTVPIVPPAPPSPPKPTMVTPRPQQNPLSGFDKNIGDNPNGFGSNASNAPDNMKPDADKVTGAKDATPVQNATATTPQIDPRHPMARPTLEQQHVRPAIFAENKVGTANIGPIALDARWDSYAEYIQRLIETVQREWDNILSGDTHPPAGTTVMVKFVLTSDGKISQIIDVNSTSTEQGRQACLAAITNPSPYGKWTNEMISVLGNEQELTFMFYYQ